MWAALRQQRAALKSLRPETLLIQTYSLMVALAFGVSAVIFVGGDKRFSGPEFRAARNLVQWTEVNSRFLWGLLFLTLGIVLVYSIGRGLAVHALRFGLVVHVFLAISFLASALQNPTAALIGLVAFLVFGALHLMLSVHLDAYGWR